MNALRCVSTRTGSIAQRNAEPGEVPPQISSGLHSCNSFSRCVRAFRLMPNIQTVPTVMSSLDQWYLHGRRGPMTQMSGILEVAEACSLRSLGGCFERDRYLMLLVQGLRRNHRTVPPQ